MTVPLAHSSLHMMVCLGASSYCFALVLALVLQNHELRNLISNLGYLLLLLYRAEFPTALHPTGLRSVTYCR